MKSYEKFDQFSRKNLSQTLSTNPSTPAKIVEHITQDSNAPYMYRKHQLPTIVFRQLPTTPNNSFSLIEHKVFFFALLFDSLQVFKTASSVAGGCTSVPTAKFHHNPSAFSLKSPMLVNFQFYHLFEIKQLRNS